MREARRCFKSKLKWCQDNEYQIKMDILATHHKEKDFKSFWKQTKKLETASCLPASIDGKSEPHHIAEVFRKHFKVESPLGPVQRVFDIEEKSCSESARFTAKEVANVINNMTRGKSPGHDDLSIEHLQYAGVHLPRVLTMLYNACIGHEYLPQELMKTIVVPVLKNKTGDATDKNNYRPISLATVIAKVLDGLLDRRISKHIQVHEAQFGFIPELSTKTAILRLKHTVQYYFTRKTPV
ncbi:unnamed protein product [Parnassius apollo]|uniref:(apollo) hypothetical protein n=1 Tax=Parnassius apollo TaxID=110799 RepID=A0A8S3XMT2_PARAO|nr:unnamed protein product [Parnassius apollo]